jgi:hypothetical protein
MKPPGRPAREHVRKKQTGIAIVPLERDMAV